MEKPKRLSQEEAPPAVTVPVDCRVTRFSPKKTAHHKALRQSTCVVPFSSDQWLTQEVQVGQSKRNSAMRREAG